MIEDSHYGDKPLVFHWRALDEGWINALDLPPARNRAYVRARASIVLEALIPARVQPGKWISYSRRKEWYSSGRRYRRTDYSFSTVPDVVNELECLHLLEHDRAPPGRLGRQSRFRATPALVAAVAVPVVVHDPGEIIRLRDTDGNLIDYRDTDAIFHMRRKLARINEALRGASIDLAGVEGPIATIDGHPVRDQLHRVFNRGSFDL